MGRHNEFNTQTLTYGPCGAANVHANGVKIFKAKRSCIVRSIDSVHAVAASSATVMLKKLVAASANDGISTGTDLLTAGINMSATADNWQAGALITSDYTLSLAPGDCLCLLPSGTTTSYQGGIFNVEIQAL